jgi:hypothetical protein
MEFRSDQASAAHRLHQTNRAPSLASDATKEMLRFFLDHPQVVRAHW